MAKVAHVVPLKGEQVKVGSAVVREAPASLARQKATRDVRLRELAKIMRGRHGAGLIQDPAVAIDYALFAAHHIKEPNAIAQWIDLNTPCLSAVARDEIVRAAVEAPRRWKAAQAGQYLKLTYEERCAWAITTIRAEGLTRTEHQILRDVRKRERDRAKAQIRRRKAGAMTRAEYLEKKTSTSALASQVGVSARTLRARREEIEYLKILQGFVVPQLYRILGLYGPRHQFPALQPEPRWITFRITPRGKPVTIDASELEPIGKRLARALLNYSQAKMQLADILAEQIEQKERELFDPPKKRGRRKKYDKDGISSRSR